MRNLCAILGAAALLVAPSTAGADALWEDKPVCTLGAFQVCASVQNITWNAATNQLSFTVVNLWGMYGTTHSITALGFYHTTTPWDGTASLVSGPDGWNSVPPDNTQIVKNGSGFELELGVDSDGIRYGIHSGQSATFVIQLSEEFVFDENTQLRWHSQAIGGTEESIKCDTGWRDMDEPDGGSYPGCQVIPEPFTMVLLGTGLAGVGGAALRRRRKIHDVENG